MNIIEQLEAEQVAALGKEIPDFKAGDTITVHYKIVEGNKERVQQYQGVVIQRKGSGSNRLAEGRTGARGNADTPEGESGEAAHDGTGRLVASRTANIEKTDLRQFMTPEDLRRAERVAERTDHPHRQRSAGMASGAAGRRRRRCGREDVCRCRRRGRGHARER